MYNSAIFISFCTFFLGLSASAQVMEMQKLPEDFIVNFRINEVGIIYPRDSKKEEYDRVNVAYTGNSQTDRGSYESNAYRVYSKSTDKSYWQIGSARCPQNKEFTCLSVYEVESTKTIGNQQNPINDEVATGRFTLYHFDRQKGKLDAVTKCASKFTSNIARDSADLSDCYRYSKQTCDDWLKFYVYESGLSTAEFKKAEECTYLYEKIEKARTRASYYFQGDIENYKTDLVRELNAAAKPADTFKLATGTAETPRHRPTLLKYDEIIKHNNECAQLDRAYRMDTLKKETSKPSRVRARGIKRDVNTGK